MLPAASIARTENVCAPSATPVSVFGGPHAVQAPASSRHWNVAPGSLELKPKTAVEDAVAPDGPLSIVVLGGVVSTVNVCAVLFPTLPAASTCSATTVYVPSLSVSASIVH